MDWNKAIKEAIDAAADQLGSDWSKVQPLFEFHIKNFDQMAKILEKYKDQMDPELYEYLLLVRERDMKLNLSGIGVIADEVIRRAINAAVNAFAAAASAGLGLPKIKLV